RSLPARIQICTGRQQADMSVLRKRDFYKKLVPHSFCTKSHIKPTLAEAFKLICGYLFYF
ncbi:hypothetical protein, partial [Veronia pacifica]|uniref:hypothetical protein n=1 Tax=Veronia pacifica TaxID=1080227 RepID=UPI001C2F69F7